MSVRSYRAAMISGAVFAVLLFVGTGLIYGNTPDTSKSDSANTIASRYVAWLADSGHRTSVVIGGFMMVLAAIALIWFASAMANRLGAAGSPIFGFAILAAVGVAGAAVGPLAVVGGHAFGDEPLVNDGHVIWLMVESSFPFAVVIFGLAVAAFIAAVVITGRGILPAWLVWFGWLAVLGSLFGVFFLPLAITLLWFLAAGIYGAVRPSEPASAAVT